MPGQSWGSEFGDHASEDVLEEYALGRLREPGLARVEEHLLACERCRSRLVEVEGFVAAARAAARELQEEALDITHLTAAGLVRLWVERTEAGDWKASFSGQQLEGQRRFGSVAEANAYVLESFRLMFPEHECGEGCVTARDPQP